MSVFGGTRVKGTRCDGCGRISKNEHGEYVRDKSSGQVGYINNHGRDCLHDFCAECEDKLKPSYACSKCGIKPQ